MGAVTSTVRFLLNSVTLGQVKAETGSFITLVLTYLSTRCSVCVEDRDSQGSNAGRGIWMGWGGYSKPVPVHILVLWFPNVSGPLSVRLNVLISFIHSTHMCTHLDPIWSPDPLSPTGSLSPMAPETSTSVKSPLFTAQRKAERLLFLLPVLICFSGHFPLPSFPAEVEGDAEQEPP